MSVFVNSTMGQSGLVLHLDSENPKSYPGSGTVWNNIGTAGGSFVMSGNPVFSNNSMIFDGVDDNIDLVDLGASQYFNNTTGTNFSLFVTLKLISLPGYMALISSRTGDQMSMGITPTGNTFLRMDDASNHETTTPLSIGSWYTIGYTYVTDGANSYSKLFVNGVYVSTLTGWDGSGIGTNNLLWFGWQSRNNYSFNPVFLNAEVKTIQIYSRALDDIEVASNFYAVRGRIGL